MRCPTRPLALLALAALLAAPAVAQVTGAIAIDETRLQGTHENGQLLLFSPDPVQLGSSISHWDTTATPSLLMEPSITPDLPFLGLDVTPGLMYDIGWPVGTLEGVTLWALDPPGTGFDDPRPFGGAPGNPATTLGEARFNLFAAVLGAWGAVLGSDVDIDVLVTWTPLPCVEGGGAVLAAAGSIFIFRDEPSLPFPGTWYHAALAESLAGEDLSGSPLDGGGDIIVFMNSDLDEECLGPGTGWYYGLDGNNPPNQVDQAPTVLHELGHGLGMGNFTNESDGELVQGFPGIYDLFTFDTTQGQTWDEMTDAGRVASAINVRNVVWNGADANLLAQPLLDPGVPELVINAPPEVAGTYEIGLAAFGPGIPAGGLAGEFACMKDGTELGPGDTPLNGCTAATNPGELAGKIALIDRGACAFVDKVANAQAAGAIGAVIINNAGNTPLGLGGTNPAITIPAISVGRRDGNRLREASCDKAAAFLQNDRFQVTATWETPSGMSGSAEAKDLTDDSAVFYFFNPSNVELVVKVLNACQDPSFNSFWVFAAGLTNVEVEITVVDTQKGLPQVYRNPQGQAFQPIQDTEAFATCP